MTAIIAGTFSDRARIAIDSYLSTAGATVNNLGYIAGCSMRIWLPRCSSLAVVAAIVVIALIHRF